jgi:polyisoprenoid-binding protein YceI
VEVTLQSAEVDFGLGNFDARVESDEFMDVARYPTVTFVSTDINRRDDNHGTMTGDLTLHGVSHPITFDVAFNGAGPAGRRIKMGFSATGSLELSDWNINIGDNNVSGPVLLNIDVEFSSTDVEVDVDSVIQRLQGGQ